MLLTASLPRDSRFRELQQVFRPAQLCSSTGRPLEQLHR